MKTACGLFLFLACALSGGAAHKETDAPQAQAVLLDHSEYKCENCLFGNSDIYFCFKVDSKILIGHEKIRTQTWQKAPQDLLSARGQNVTIRYDDKYIWIPGPRHKDQRLTQDYTRDLFSFNPACREAVQKSAAR